MLIRHSVIPRCSYPEPSGLSVVQMNRTLQQVCRDALIEKMQDSWSHAI
jgi:hypothetical protein